MLKLYKRIDGRFHYHEAWLNDQTIYEHWGIAGERGSTKQHPFAKDEKDPISKILQPAIDSGFRPIEIENHATLMIEYTVEGMGSAADLKKRHELQERLDETLGWTGIGACDGGSIGSGTMEVCCYVIDFELAARIITKDLEETQFSDFSRIYNEEIILKQKPWWKFW